MGWGDMRYSFKRRDQQFLIKVDVSQCFWELQWGRVLVLFHPLLLSFCSVPQKNGSRRASFYVSSWTWSVGRTCREVDDKRREREQGTSFPASLFCTDSAKPQYPWDLRASGSYTATPFPCLFKPRVAIASLFCWSLAIAISIFGSQTSE